MNTKNFWPWSRCVEHMTNRDVPLTVLYLAEKAAPPAMPIVIDHGALKDILGAPPFDMEVSRRKSTCGSLQ